MIQWNKKCVLFWILAILLSSVAVQAQPNNQNSAKDPAEITKSTLAFAYRVGGGSTKIDFKGTDLMPVAGGEAKIEARKGHSEIEAKFENLSEPTRFGAEFLTFVLWSVSTEGRAENLGEVQMNKNGKGKLKARTQMEVFSLILTAEPYFAVRIPSELVVLENQKRDDTIAKIYKVEAYSLIQRGRYQKLVNPLALSLDLKKAPIEMYQARNAVSIARSNGAEEYAKEILSKAEESLKTAENALDRKGSKDYIISTARRTIQFSEDARALAVQRQNEEMLEIERRKAEQEKLERARAEADRAMALLEQEKARRKAAEEASLRAAAEADRRKAEEAERLAWEQAEREKLERARAEAERTKALLEQEKARRKAAEEASLRAAAEAESQRALAVELEARKAAQKAQRAAMEAEREAREAVLRRKMAEEEKAQLRAKLLKQFSMVLETRDTERGLVVNMSDVLFDTGRYTLRQEAREKLARISGILLNYPQLRIESEGHTDNVGSLELNQELSERRANAVREYLVSQGIPDSSITSVGKNYSMPVASNESREGRQRNRRVELIVSGEVIGVNISANESSQATATASLDGNDIFPDPEKGE